MISFAERTNLERCVQDRVVSHGGVFSGEGTRTTRADEVPYDDEGKNESPVPDGFPGETGAEIPAPAPACGAVLEIDPQGSVSDALKCPDAKYRDDISRGHPCFGKPGRSFSGSPERD
jgi:hypothetical protein